MLTKNTKDIPYLALTGELWGIFCEYLWENLPRYNGTALYVKFVRDLVFTDNSTNVPAFSLEDLLPSNKRFFARYQGSLTTPPCTQAVAWTVFGETLSMSQDQVRHVLWRRVTSLRYVYFQNITRTSDEEKHMLAIIVLIRIICILSQFWLQISYHRGLILVQYKDIRLQK